MLLVTGFERIVTLSLLQSQITSEAFCCYEWEICARFISVTSVVLTLKSI